MSRSIKEKKISFFRFPAAFPMFSNPKSQIVGKVTITWRKFLPLGVATNIELQVCRSDDGQGHGWTTRTDTSYLHGRLFCALECNVETVLCFNPKLYLRWLQSLSTHCSLCLCPFCCFSGHYIANIAYQYFFKWYLGVKYKKNPFLM